MSEDHDATVVHWKIKTSSAAAADVRTAWAEFEQVLDRLRLYVPHDVLLDLDNSVSAIAAEITMRSAALLGLALRATLDDMDGTASVVRIAGDTE